MEPDFKPLETAERILIGVSGGPDSLALTHLTAEWAAARKKLHLPAPEIFTATVDHALRPESGFEAAQAAGWAKALGLPHRILMWDGEKPRTRLQERARMARYELLLAYARALQAGVLLTAHHADDQAETILFRLLRGSGVTGLAGMEACLPRGPVLHCRPLLQMTKAALIEACEKRGQPFLADPSNSNPCFARTRLRAMAAGFARAGLDREALLRLGKRAARAEEALSGRANFVASQLAPQRRDGFAQADLGMLSDEPEEIWLRVLAAEIGRATGGQQPLRLDRLEMLVLALRAACFAQKSYAATLGGAKLRLQCSRKDEKPLWLLSIQREGVRRTAAKKPVKAVSDGA